MSNYQRLISYIYTYEGGIRGKNIGFAKLETRGSQCRITVNVKKIFVGGNPVGVYLLSGQDEVKIGTLFARNGAGEFRTMVNSADVENSGHSLEEFYGLSVHDVESAWRSYTTIWEDAVAHAAEVELADVTSEKVAMKHEITAKVQSALQTEEKEQELLPISREIEEQVEKEAVLQEESVCEATDRKQAETGSRVYDAEQGKIVHLSSEIPKVSRNTVQTAESRAFTSGLRENSQIRQNEAAVPDEKAWRDPALPDAADAEAVKKEEVNADETNRDRVIAPEVNPAEFSSAEVNSSEVNSSEVNSTEVNSSEAHLPEAEPEELKPVAEIIRGDDIQEADKTEDGTGIFAESAAQETLPISQSAVETVKRRMPVWRMPEPEPEPVNGSAPVTEEPLQEMEIPKAETALPQQEDAGEDEAIQGLDSTVTSEVEYIEPGLAKTNRHPEFQPNNAAPGMSEPVVHSSGMMLQESSGRQQPEQLRQGQMPTTQRIQNQMQPGHIRQSQMQPAQGQAVQPQTRQEQMQAMQQMLRGQMQSAQMRQNQLRQGQMQQSRSQEGQTQQNQGQQSQTQQGMTQPGQMQQNLMHQSQVQQPQMQAAQMKMSQDRGGRASQRYGTPRRGMQSGALRNETLKPESLGPAQEEQTDDRKETQADMCETSPPSGVTAPFKDLSDICDEQEVWEMMRKKYPKILAFDYADGCEVLTIKPQDIGLLPREEWVYGSNSFLLHGYYNYRYLILARLNNPEGKARYLLGVPGHYLSNEKYMASMFGFSNFVLAKKQPPRDSRFGYWYTDVKIGD